MDERDYRAMNAELKNQTAVEWLFNNLYNKDTINDCTLRAFEQAKKMEKQQIIDAFVDVSKANCETFKIPFTNKDEKDFTVIAENYYQETYKK
jgi:hypothetical protein